MIDKRAALLKKYSPMTKAQLRAVVADYAVTFPDWTLVHDGTAFARKFGPVQQIIGFQKMSSGSYRPMHGISALALPEAHIRMLPQLPFRPSTMRQTSHSHRWPEMLAAMEQQFKPDIRKPLDIAEVLALCETEAGAMPDTTNNMSMLAILSAWLGRDAEALDYCERMQHCPLPMLAPMPEWEEAMRGFGRDLARAIAVGRGRAFLEEAITQRSAA
jgi:hypothetical protein